MLCVLPELKTAVANLMLQLSSRLTDFSSVFPAKQRVCNFKRLGIDDEIISRASELVSNENRQFEDVVEKLEKRRQSLEKQLENANRLTAKANTEKQKAENEMQKAKQRAEREIEKARQEAQRIISRTRAHTDAVAEELEKARKAKDMSVQARTQLKKNIDKMEAHADPVKARNTLMRSTSCRDRSKSATRFLFTISTKTQLYLHRRTRTVLCLFRRA